MAKTVIGSYGGTAALPKKVTVYSDGSTSESSSSSTGSTSTKSSGSTGSTGSSSTKSTVDQSQIDAFNKAFSGLTPAEQALYISKNPNIGIANIGGQGASQYSFDKGLNTYKNTISNTPITTKDMMGASAVDIKTSQPPTPDYVMGYDKAADAAVKAGMQTQTDLAQRESDTAKLMKDYLKSEPERVEVPQELQRAKETALKQANEIKSQIDMINAQLQANLQQLRQTGSQEGVTEAVYGGQQLQLNREAAIKLMPLTATYQAAVDNYNAAKEIVSDWVTQENAYLDRYQSWKNGIFEKAFSYAVGKEEQALEEARYQENNAINARKERLNRIDDYYKLAIDSGDKATAESIAKMISQVDAPNFDSTFASTISRITPTEGSDLLSVAEATALGVPYGTTQSEAMALGKIPSKGMTAGAKEDLATMDTVVVLGNKLLNLGDVTGFAGVGGMGYGTIAEFLGKNFGAGSKEGQDIRNLIGNIKGTIAKLRGGTSFTPNEQTLLESYVPTINDNPMIIQSKIQSLNDFINIKKGFLVGNQGSQDNDPLGIL